MYQRYVAAPNQRQVLRLCVSAATMGEPYEAGRPAGLCGFKCVPWRRANPYD